MSLFESGSKVFWIIFSIRRRQASQSHSHALTEIKLLVPCSILYNLGKIEFEQTMRPKTLIVFLC